MKKKRCLLILLTFLLLFCFCSCNANSDTETESGGLTTESGVPEGDAMKIDVQIGSTTLTATLADHSSAKAFYELLKQGEITVDMHDYNSFEKVGDLPQSIVTNDEKITTEPGDIILYQGDQITIYYDTNTWNFTRLGKIDGVSQDELKKLLGTGNVSVTFRLHQEQTQVAEFDFEKKTVMLNSGYEMPIMGLGTYALSDEECYNSVTALLENGGRLIDTAYMYHNEAAVGRAVRDSDVPREEIFVTTKIYPNQFANAAEAIGEALEKTGLDYIDLMLLHHPGDGDVGAYKALEQAVADGKIRSIGLSNWYVEELKEFLPQISITPAVVQNEIHPYYQENDVIPYIQGLGIVVEGWYPFGGRGHMGEMLGNETISAIGKAHGVTSAQVILRWNLQKGVVVIPGSSNPEHIKENLDIYRFELTDEEMSAINALDRNEKHDWY